VRGDHARVIHLHKRLGRRILTGVRPEPFYRGGFMTTARLRLAIAMLSWFACFVLISAIIADAFR